MRWLITIAIIGIAVIVGLSIFLQPNSFLGCSDKPQAGTACKQADAIVVISGGDTSTRTSRGVQLYKNGWADTIIFSGAAQDKSGPSNAQAMQRQATTEGVNENAIFVDESSVNTQENAKNVAAILQENNFSDIILVTSGYHQRRASLEFNKAAPEVMIRNYPVVNDADWSWFWWLTPRGWWLAGGEVAKIIAFYAGVSS